MNGQTEMLDVIDENDNVIGYASKEDVYKSLLPHRIVHVLVFNNDGKLLLQKRDEKKDFRPLHWITSAGGHVQRGESVEEAASRELSEEIGIISPLEYVNKFWYYAPDHGMVRKSLNLFKTLHDGPFKIDENEVEEVKFFDFKEISDLIKLGEKIHPELLFILENHFGAKF